MKCSPVAKLRCTACMSGVLLEGRTSKKDFAPLGANGMLHLFAEAFQGEENPPKHSRSLLCVSKNKHNAN